MKYLAILLLAISLFAFRHPYYVSICRIDHNPKTSSLEITFKIFSDDLENALEKRAPEKLYLGDERESENADRYLFDYLRKKFIIKVNGQPTQFEPIGKESEIDVTWCYVEILNVKEIKDITITNRILMEMFESQTNIIHIKIGDHEKSMLLNKGKSTETIAF